jgi:hypothetical protein
VNAIVNSPQSVKYAHPIALGRLKGESPLADNPSPRLQNRLRNPSIAGRNQTEADADRVDGLNTPTRSRASTGDTYVGSGGVGA